MHELLQHWASTSSNAFLRKKKYFAIVRKIQKPSAVLCLRVKEKVRQEVSFLNSSGSGVVVIPREALQEGPRHWVGRLSRGDYCWLWLSCRWYSWLWLCGSWYLAAAMNPKEGNVGTKDSCLHWSGESVQRSAKSIRLQFLYFLNNIFPFYIMITVLTTILHFFKWADCRAKLQLASLFRFIPDYILHSICRTQFR